MDLNFFETLYAKQTINGQASEMKPLFLASANEGATLSPKLQAVIESIFDSSVELLKENLDEVDEKTLNGPSPILSIVSIIPNHIKEFAEKIYDQTNIDLGNLTPDNAADDLTKEEFKILENALMHAIQDAQNGFPNQIPAKVEKEQGINLSMITNGTPQISQGTEQDTLLIGNVCASDYFQSFASPDLAAARAEISAQTDQDTTPRNIETAPLPTQNIV